MTNEIK